MTDDFKYFNKIDDGYLCVSPFFGEKHEIEGKVMDRRVRLVSMKLGGSSDLAIDKKIETKEGAEVRLKTTEKGEQEIKAYFFEDTKQVKTLTVQRWMTKTGNPHISDSMVLYGDQLELLLKFVKAYSGIPSYGNGKLEIPLDVALEKSKENIQVSEDAVIEYLKNNPSLIKTIVESEIDEGDLISLSYRKKQLTKFNKLLSDDEYFNKKKSDLAKIRTTEGVWQSFFEENT